MSSTTEEQTTETKRGRVRRLLIDPLRDSGMRKSGDMTAERFEKMLVTLQDELSYMTDAQLSALREMLASKGQGKDRRAWPALVTIRSIAENVAPRPIEEHPTIVSWFGSARGREAQVEGTLVAEFMFLEKYKRPPLGSKTGPGDWMRVRTRAQELREQEARIRDRVSRRVEDADDRQWLAWYERTTARAEALIPAAEGAL